MAKLDDLISQVPDGALRDELTSAAKELRRRKQFGLVFEEHIPEVALLPDFPLQSGQIVHERADTKLLHSLRVKSVQASKATVEPADAKGDEKKIAIKDLFVLKRFGEPIYPGAAPRSAGC
jgi:adenine-specific DNA-methyltransferase